MKLHSIPLCICTLIYLIAASFNSTHALQFEAVRTWCTSFSFVTCLDYLCTFGLKIPVITGGERALHEEP